MYGNIEIISGITAILFLNEDTNVKFDVYNLSYFNLKMAVNKYRNQLVFRLCIYKK